MNMVLTPISSGSILSVAWNNIYTLVNTISDPSSRGVSWIFAAFPESRKGTADVYPAIIIESANAVGKNLTFTHANRVYTF